MPTTSNAFPKLATILCFVGICAFVLLALSRTGGVLVYTLDDPYIHLALAESILGGGYGINEGEFASPSSSILYPLILAFALMLGLGSYAPLLIGSVFSLMATWIIASFFSKLIESNELRVSAGVYLLLGLTLVFSVSAIALPMNGMEHSIHVFATALTLTRLYALLVEDNTDGMWTLVFAALLCAGIRFEGLALVGCVILALGFSGHRRPAITLATLLLAMLSIYIAAMSAMGLPLFPSSVLVKSPVARDSMDGNLFGLIGSFSASAIDALKNPQGMVVAISTALFGMFSMDRSRPTKVRVFFLVICGMLLAHLLAGDWGWFGRYEVYLVAAMIIGVGAVLRLSKNIGNQSIIAAFAAFAVFAFPYFNVTILSPPASANTYQQQYQMSRFAQDMFRENVAVNDIGLVAYQNENKVLDLGGLGSEDARLVRLSGGWTADRLDQVTQKNDIVYAMIYDHWFGDLPDHWCLGARLSTSQVTSASDTVSFYLINPDLAAEFSRNLQMFSAELPPGATLTTYNCVET